MRIWREWTLSWATIVVVVWTLVGTTAVRADEPLEAGVATIDITPLPGCRMSGYFSERTNTGTLDPLLAKAVVFRQGETSAALVFCDLSAISLDVSDRTRDAAARLTGIPRDNIAIAATHSHTGPLYFGALRKHFHDRAVTTTGHDPYELVDYPTELVGRLVRAIIAARERLGPVDLTAGYAHEDRLSFNRRFHMRDGTVRFNPGHQNPNIVRVAGPIDPEVGLITLTSRGDVAGTKAAIVAFALHLDTLSGTLYSADYPRYLQQRLRETEGEAFVSLFAAGTCGDINHVDASKPAGEGRRKTEPIGTMLAETVSAKLAELGHIEQPALAVRSRRVDAELQSYTPEEIAAAQRDMELVDSRELSFLRRVEAYKIMALELRDGSTIPLEVQAFRLGEELAIVTLPGEVFVDLGLAIKQASPFQTTVLIELTNDAPGYIPTRKAFAEGSYETVNSRVVPGSGEAMVAVAVKLLNELADE